MAVEVGLAEPTGTMNSFLEALPKPLLQLPGVKPDENRVTIKHTSEPAHNIVDLIVDSYSRPSNRSSKL